MTDALIDKKQILQRIANTLGMDAAVFLAQQPVTEAVPDTLEQELLIAFGCITDLNDRRACLDFVRSVANRQQLPLISSHTSS